MKIKLFYFLGFLFLVSCGPSRNLAYFSDLEQQAAFSDTLQREAKIQPDDLLGITISSLNPESNALFNRGVLTPTGTNLNPAASTPNEGYLVDENGFIDFPIIGKLKLGGLTKAEAKNKIIFELKDYLKDPIVNVRFLNFKVTVIGEVNKPSTFTIPNDKINILEALGLAGDMTAFGRRENVLIIREKDGVRNTVRVNLNSKDLLSSPYFNLQQNDIVYVEPDKAKAIQATVNPRNTTIIAATMSAIAIILSRIL